MFPHTVVRGYIFLTGPLKYNMFVLMTSTFYQVLLLCFVVVWVLLGNICLPQGYKYFLIFSRSSIVWALMFRSVIHFKLIFADDLRFMLLSMDIQLFHQHLLYFPQ